MTTVFWLLKFCKERAHADDFIAGSLFLRRLDYFRGLEEADDGRGDRFEGVSHIMQPDMGVVMRVNGVQLSTSSSDWASAALITPQAILDQHALCVYAGSSGPFTSLYQENIDEFRQYMRVPEKCASMGGEHVVCVHNVTAFQERLGAACQRERFNVTGRLVTYYDEGAFHGTLEPMGFCKSRRFEWQRERRFLIDGRGRLPDPARLEIGSLADIASVMDLSTFNATLTLDLPND